MQTLTEKKLIHRLSALIKQAREDGNDPPRLLNIGAGASFVVETALEREGLVFLADRIDVEECRITHPLAGQSYSGSVESMPMIDSGTYKAAYANFVFEHVADPGRAAGEIHRVLAPGGYLVVAIPNPAAPEFLLGRYTSLWFRRMIRGKQAWETHYSYKNIADFCRIFTRAGFVHKTTDCFPAVFSYLNRYPLIGLLAKSYDKSLVNCNARSLMGHACIVMQKGPGISP